MAPIELILNLGIATVSYRKVGNVGSSELFADPVQRVVITRRLHLYKIGQVGHTRYLVERRTGEIFRTDHPGNVELVFSQYHCTPTVINSEVKTSSVSVMVNSHTPSTNITVYYYIWNYEKHGKQSQSWKLFKDTV